MGSEQSIKGFAPLVSLEVAPKALIMGSMPSVKSLEDGQYYAHSRNQFWWIMSQIFHWSDGLSYHQRCQALTHSGYALWDVVASCQRQGSLDSSIKPSTVVENRLDYFFECHNQVKWVFFNGVMAKQLYFKFFSDEFDALQYQQLPSTSPAMASLSKYDKLIRWRQAFESIG